MNTFALVWIGGWSLALLWNVLLIAYHLGRIDGIRWCAEAREEIERQRRVRELRP